MTTLLEKDQAHVQALIRSLLEANDELRALRNGLANGGLSNGASLHMSQRVGEILARQHDLLQPYLAQRAEFLTEHRADSAIYQMPLEWPAIPEDGVYAKGWIHRGLGEDGDDYDIHDQSSFKDTRPCENCKPVVILDHDRYVQLTQPPVKVHIEHMKESHRETWWVVLTDRDRPAGAKPWDGGRLEVFMTEKLPHAWATAEEWAEFFGTTVVADPIKVPPRKSLYSLRDMRTEARDLINRLEAARPPNILKQHTELAGEAFGMLRLFLMNCEPQPPVGNQ